MLFILVPVAAITFDVVGKVFSNMYYPTQTQIHLEIQAKEAAEKKKRARESPNSQVAGRTPEGV